MNSPSSTSDIIFADLSTRLAQRSGVQVIGLCGAQGSGKSFVTRDVAGRLTAQGFRCATLALDDLYLGHRARAALAREVHPLLATRGPPGTHEVGLGLAILDGLRAGAAVTIPAFDKLADDRRPADAQRVDGPVDVVLFEGWCVGARPEPAATLVSPINALERDRDPEGVWRSYVNDALAGPYQGLFSQIDALVFLQAPSFGVVQGWRYAQELANAAVAPGRRPMSEAQVAEFIQYYERITRRMLADMPGYADLVVRLDDHRQPIGSSTNRRPAP